MPIRPGTTARQLQALGRWTLVVVYAVALLTWWRGGYRVWGALSAALLLALALWVLGQVLLADRTLPGNCFHLVLLIPAAVLAYHLAGARGAGDPPDPGLGGIINLSMIFHLSLLALAVLVTQALLARGRGFSLAASLCGAAAMIGAFPAAVLAPAGGGEIRVAAGLVGFSGIFVWLAAPWRFEVGDSLPSRRAALWRRRVRAARAAVACAAAVLLTWASPTAARVALGAAGGVAMTAGIILPGRRAAWLISGAAAAAVSLAAQAVIWGPPVGLRLADVGWFGQGERAFSHVTAGDNGARVLTATVGSAGAALAGAAALGCLIRLLVRARRLGPKDRGRAVMWSAAAALAGCATLARGGLFLPSANMMVALTWALAGEADGTRRRRNGAVLLGAAAAVMLAMGLAQNPGLAQWSVGALGAEEDFLHAPAGFLLALLVAWLMGTRRFWLGLLGVLLAALAGPGGEILQGLVSARGVQQVDWLLHVAGCAAALLCYGLCMGVRRGEKPGG